MQLSDIPFIQNDCYWNTKSTNNYEKDKETVHEYMVSFMDGIKYGIVSKETIFKIGNALNEDKTHMGLLFKNLHAKICLMAFDEEGEQSYDKKQYDTMLEIYVETTNKLYQLQNNLN